MKKYTHVFILFFFLFIGCATVQKSGIIKPEISKTEEAGQTTQVEPPSSGTPSAAQSKMEELTLPKYERPKAEQPLPKAEPIDPKRLALEDRPVMINVDGMPLSDFIIYAIGDTLKVAFFMDEAVKNMKTPVTLRMTQEMPAAKALEIAIEVLRQHDLIVEERAGALYILKSKPAPRQPEDIKVGRTVADSSAQVVQIVPLRHLRAGDLVGLITDFYKTNVSVKVYPDENALLLAGPALSIKEIISFVEIMDVPYLREKKLFLIQLTYWQPDEFIKQMTTILEGIGFTVARTSRDPGILFIPIKFLNCILAVSPDDNTTKVVLDWKNRLDTAEAAGTEEKAFTYTPKYSRASDLVDALKKLYMIAPAVPKTPSSVQVSPPSAISPGLKIASDDKRNIVLILTSPAEYKGLLSFLERLDVSPRQVLIEATVAELTLRDELKYGLEWFFRNKMLKGDYTLQTLFSVPTGGPGLVYQYISDAEKFNVAINAFALDDKVNILSTPRLMVLDNEEATIQVGTDIPIITGEVTAADVSQAAPSIMRNIQYRNTGVILRVKPTINTEGLLTLNISIEVSEMGTNPPGMDSPTILMRRATTTVVAAQGKTIVLGGLISENKSFTVSKVPILGDIPLIGMLFKTTSKTDNKTELIIFLKPAIITNIDQASKITNELKNELKWLK